MGNATSFKKPSHSNEVYFRYLSYESKILTFFICLFIKQRRNPKKRTRVFLKLCRLNNIKDDFSKNDCEMKYIYMYTSRYSFDITKKLLKTS